MPKTDEQLVSEYLADNKDSLEILVKRYLKPVYRFAYKYADDVSGAEDIAQEVFIKAWRNLKRFDQSKNFKTWLFTITKNTALDFLKKKEKREILAIALKKLSPEFQTVVASRHENNLTFQQIADRLGESMNTVKSRYRRAVIAFKKS